MDALAKSASANRCSRSRRRRAQAVVARTSTTGGTAAALAAVTTENWAVGTHLTVVGVETTEVEVEVKVLGTRIAIRSRLIYC